MEDDTGSATPGILGRKLPRRGFLAASGAVAVATYFGTRQQPASASGSADYFVSPSGSDSNPGTEAAPFKTIDKARQVVRANKVTPGLTAPVTVMLRGGTYYLESAVTFTQSDSGTAAYPITYTNYPNETPIIVGCRQFTSWTAVSGFSGSVYKTSTYLNVDVMYANGTMIKKARFPKTGDLRVERPIQDGSGNDSTNQFHFEPGSLNPWTDATSAEVCIWASPGNNVVWQATIPIADPNGTGIDRTSRTVTLAANANLGIGPGNRYYLQNVKAELGPGEFYVDKSTSPYTVYYWPVDPIASQTVAIPTVNDIFVMSGTSGPAHNIIIDGLTFSGGNFTDTFVDSLPDPAGNTSWTWNRTPAAYRHGAIRISNAQSITVQHCYINNVPFCGVVLDGFAQSNVITSNEIAQFGYYGVLAMGSEVGALDSSSHQIYDSKLNTISNNYIHDGGLTVGHGSGILMNQSGENQVLHNLIRNLPRYGISLKGDGPTMLGDNGVSSDVYIGGVAVTWANHWDWITSKSNTFKYNDISAVNNYATDTGGVHLHGCGKGNVVDTNRVHDIALPAEFADLNPACSYGIYLDGRSDYTTVQNNIVYGIHGGPGKSPIFVSSTNQQIYNNIFVATFGSAAAISDFVYPTPAAAGAGKHNYQHNIVMCKGGVQAGQWGVRDNARGALITFYGNPGFGYSNNWKTSTSAADPVDRVVASDYNLFWDLAGLNSIEGIHGDKWPVGGNPYDTLTAWKALFSNLYDQHSQTGDPLFTNPTAGDFSVASGSPALAVGFTQIDQASIGLTSAYQVVGRNKPN